MKKLHFFKLIVIVCLIISFSFINANVSASATQKVSQELIQTSSSALVSLGIMKGDEKGNLKLNDRITRCEFVALVNRMMDFENNTNVDNIELPFKDIKKKHWAYNTLRVALKRELINGYPDNTVRPDATVNFAEANAILIRALGHHKTLTGNWPDNVLNKSRELSISKGVELDKYKELTRGEASVLIYNSLTVDIKK
ncbi:MAG TPA: S-layer homology domain-containing protein [Clostridiaceae bacterium]|nr:S-layer homology domain-containing protein [Clostridiaceae bacterium]